MANVRNTISDTLAILRHNLEEGLNNLQPLPNNGEEEDFVVIANIANWENNDSFTPAMDNSVVLTLIKTEEEYVLKNRPNHRRNPLSGNLEYINPAVFLNLHLLITPNVNDYTAALSFLSRIISYFQHQRVFTNTNSELPEPNFPIQSYHFNVSMESPSLEQLNHLWSIMGGKMMPAAMYKLQIQQIEYIPDDVTPASPITIISVNEQIV